MSAIGPSFARRFTVAVLATLSFGAALLPAGAAGAEHALRAGVGRADITPATDYYLGGWTRADRHGLGVHTRLHASALVLQRGARKVALVAVELFAIPAGLQEDVAGALAGRGFTHENVLLSASHTHAGPGGFFNYPTYNSAAPSIETVTDPQTYVNFFLTPQPADPMLYTFLVNRIATAIARADNDRGPAVAGWGHTKLIGLTQNRSLEAFLANRGVNVEFGQGNVDMTPGGYVDTIDPAVDVLRVDKLVRRSGRRVRRPIGAWSNFADHGTVTKATFQAYNEDHHASALRVFEETVRRVGRVPNRQAVINVYGNANEGDQTAGIKHSGPAGSDEVGRIEARAFLRAWRSAGRRLLSRPALDVRWTRVCFCGQPTKPPDADRIDTQGVLGMPFLTGSEEGRGPLYDVTRIPFEGVRMPFDSGAQGDKVQVTSDFPTAAPFTVVRVADGLIASIPGEATKEAGARVKRDVLAAAAPMGIRSVAIAGLANEYLNYIATPEEYERQHYEGGSTLFGVFEAPFVQLQLADLARRMAAGAPAPDAFQFDPNAGVHADGPPYPAGAATGTITTQPAGSYERLGHPRIAWRGGPRGLDRPLDAPFISAQRLVRGKWRTAANDLGLAILWRVDDEGAYTAYWEPPLDSAPGTYRFVVTATRYKLVFEPFALKPLRSLKITPVYGPAGHVSVRLDYPPAVENVDLTYRPRSARGGVVSFRVEGRLVTVRQRHDSVFSVPVPVSANPSVTIDAGAARDRYGNANGAAVSVP